MDKKKTIGILAVVAIVLIILIAAGTKKEMPAPEELTGEEQTETVSTTPANAMQADTVNTADTTAKPETQQADSL